MTETDRWECPTCKAHNCLTRVWCSVCSEIPSHRPAPQRADITSTSGKMSPAITTLPLWRLVD